MRTLTFFLTLCAVPALAEGNRELDAHEHGVGTLNIAIDGSNVAMEFAAPGADIVGFEHPAKSEEDKALISEGLAVLSEPLGLFGIPADAECSVTSTVAELEGDAEHDDHEDHDHDEAHGEHDKHDDHDDHADHDDHDDHDEHAEEEHGEHTEFHAEYVLTCDAPAALSQITFGYFDRFENARELEVQVVTTKGASAFEVTRVAPVLDLGGLF